MGEESYTVTEIRSVNSKKKLICLDGVPASFQLYNSEIARYKITEGGCISFEVYKIIREVLAKRARERSLHIVAKQDITENMLRTKLAAGGYDDDIIDNTVCFMKEHGFINDERYASGYVWCKADTRSRKQIESYLYGKGISGDIIERACSDYYSRNSDAQDGLIRRLIEKRRADVMSMTCEERSKLVAYLMRRGFDYDSVSRVIEDMRDQ